MVDLLLIFAGLTYIINNYDREKKTARQNELAMKRLSEEKSKLISIISHDFRTPLRNFQGYLNILKRTDLDNAERTQLEEELARSTEETQRLLDNLLSWTMKHIDGSAGEILSIGLATCLSEPLSNFSRAASFKGVAFISRLPQDLVVKVNPSLLQMMLRNFIDNALKFTPRGGSITVDAELLDQVCLLRVKDTGKGIAPADYESIFSLNVRSSFGTDGEKGVGLGLALCKEFADLQGIAISFESQLGQGTTFSLAIPVA